MSSISKTDLHDPSNDVQNSDGLIEQEFVGVKTLVKQGAIAVQSEADAYTTFVMLPAYNEAEGLPSLLEKIKQVFATNGQPYQVIVVDDASTDDTSEIAITAAQDMPLTLVRHQINQNLPGALRSGMMKAIEMGSSGDVIVTMDGDDTHPPGSINCLLQKISEGYDVVTASRYQIGSRVMGVPFIRVLMTWLSLIHISEPTRPY